ncbi:MAG: hypothetical protein QG635_1483 [Bacteroidota bacterium]|nr:hypothetical protein [Bacteroidota bacterium]
MTTLLISDTHLGSEVCRSKELLKTIRKTYFDRLILLGDIFDGWNFSRLRGSHWKVMSFIRKASKTKEVIWVAGNHDGSSNILSHILGVNVYDEYIFEQGGRKILAIHGHQFDKFLSNHKVISDMSSWVYLNIQKYESNNQKLSRWLKSKSKSWLRLAHFVASGAAKYAEKKGVDMVICGHTHLAGEMDFGKIKYYNTGCWTDIPSNFITIPDNGIPVIHTQPEPVHKEEIDFEPYNEAEEINELEAVMV